MFIQITDVSLNISTQIFNKRIKKKRNFKNYGNKTNQSISSTVFKSKASTQKKTDLLKLLPSLSPTASPPFKTPVHPTEHKPFCGCLEKGALPIVYLNNHFPWNENRSIIRHWYLLSYWGTFPHSWLSSGSGLSEMGAAMAESCPLSVDSELGESKLNSGLRSLGIGRTPLMTSSTWHS